MKKWIAAFVVVALIAVAWYMIRTYARIDVPGSEPKWEKITRGDIRVPITASGLIEPKERIEIKPLASGEISEINVVEGDYVHVGDALVEIKKDDEQRNVERAQQVKQRAEIATAKSRLAVDSAEQAIKTAESRLKELQANGEKTNSDYVYEQEQRSRGASSERTVLLFKVANEVNQAQVEQARIAIENAKTAWKDAMETVKVQETAVKEAEKDLEETQLRLRETTVISKYDAIVTEVKVKKQMVVQSGRSAFGGTPILTLADVSQLEVVARVDEADYGRVTNIAPPDALPAMPGLRKSVELEMKRAATQAASEPASEPASGSASQPTTDEASPEAREGANEIRERSGLVSVVVEAFPDQTFAGRIVRVEPQGKLNTGASVIQYDVHVLITDPMAYRLPLGTQAQVEFTVESVKDVLTVPADAVKSVAGQKGLYIHTANDARNVLPRFVPCRFGITDGSRTQLIGPIGGEKLDESTEVYTKLPPIKDENEE